MATLSLNSIASFRLPLLTAPVPLCRGFAAAVIRALTLNCRQTAVVRAGGRMRPGRPPGLKIAQVTSLLIYLRPVQSFSSPGLIQAFMSLLLTPLAVASALFTQPGRGLSYA
jgi:hypothetical protein